MHITPPGVIAKAPGEPEIGYVAEDNSNLSPPCSTMLRGSNESKPKKN